MRRFGPLFSSIGAADPKSIRPRIAGPRALSALDIDKSRTCLVQIDLQKGITAMETQPHDVKTVVANAAELARAF